jgi:hypothetical protein
MMTGIECPGGRIPQFSFELTTAASQLSKSPMETTGNAAGFAQADGIWSFSTDPLSHVMTTYYSTDPGTKSLVSSILLPTPYTQWMLPSAVQGARRPTAFYYTGLPSPNRDVVRLIDLQTGAMTEIFSEPFGTRPQPLGLGTRPRAAYDPINDSYVILYGDSDVYLSVLDGPAEIVCDTTHLETKSAIAFYDGLVYALAVIGNVASIVVISAETGVEIAVIQEPSAAFAEVDGNQITADAGGVFCYIFAGSDSRSYQVSFDSPPTTASWRLLASELDFYVAGRAPASGQSNSNFLASSMQAMIGPDFQGQWTFIRYAAYDPLAIPVSAVIAGICEEAGETRYDVSGIPESDLVWGYKRTNPASARSNLEPLLTAFSIFIVDEDGFIKFKKYENIGSVATISFAELGQSEDGSEPSDAMPLSRTQEIDLPRTVTVNYIEKDFDYQTASERESRQVTGATEDMQVDVPLALNDGPSEAKKIATQVLYQRHRSQNTRSTKVSRKYAFLSPGDGVTIEYPQGTSRLWRVMSMTDTGALVELNLEPGDAQLFQQTAIGATGYAGQTVAPLPPPTRLQLLDTSILRDEDNNGGLYAAMSGLSDGWPGAELFIGDSDVNLASVGTVANEAVSGFAETALGAWTPGLVDETNLLTVNVGRFELSSISRSALLNGAANIAAIGGPGRWEIIKFQRADDLGSGRYILSGLLRGIRGTEWARGLHRVSDVFVLMGIPGTLRPNFDTGSIGQTKAYRAITKGRNLDSGSSQFYANTAEGLKPFSPDVLRKSVSSNDIVLTWSRRTRLSENWLLGIVPLGEESERWEIDVFSSSAFTTVKRTLTSTTTTVTYSSAQQVLDFGSNQTTLYVRIYQISGQVGRGHVLEATL